MNLTKVDWLAFRTQASVPEAIDAVRAAFGSLGGAIGAKPRKRGLNGFQQAADLQLDGMQVGLMQYGGESQKGWIHVGITGRGCEWIKDWEEADHAVARLERFQYRRVDIAFDTYKREVTHDKVVAAHGSGKFTTNGKPPKINCHIPGDPYDGRTAYIGTRDSEKFLRAYEKGFEIAKGFPASILKTIGGVPIEDIYRLELELKPNKSALPEDIIEKRDQYFSGAYPYLHEVLQAEPEVWSRRREKGPQVDLEAALAHIKFQYGTTLFTALAAYGGDVGAVWERIVGSEHSDRLLRSGVMLVEHGDSL